MMTKLPVAYVEWVDSQTTYGWRKHDPREDNVPCLIKSVGILVYDEPGAVTLSTSVSQNGNYADVITIPRCAIQKIKRIKLK